MEDPIWGSHGFLWGAPSAAPMGWAPSGLKVGSFVLRTPQVKPAFNNSIALQQVEINTRPVVASDIRSKVRLHREVVSLSPEETRNQVIQEVG